MCEIIFNKDDMLNPRECLIKYGKGAHRICQYCWWEPETGFAREEGTHKCPGCEKKLPLSSYEKDPPIFVDLTEDE
jgi:hypothetical protein